MKKYIFISVAALLSLAACTKVTGDGNETQREIRFEVANYATKANVEYDQESNFGTYAWFNDGSGTAQDFMTNEIVGFADGVWKTVERPFFWPKTGNIDFISYSPFAGTNGEAPATSATAAEGTTNGQSASQEETPAAPEPIITRLGDKNYTFEYGTYRANGSQFDLMYADVAAGQTEESKKDTYTSISGVTGVPTLFHHALARVSFKLKANFIDDSTDQQEATTYWDIKLQEAYLYGVRDAGSLKLTMNADGSWKLPEVGDEKAHVWTSDAQGDGLIMMYQLPETEENNGTQQGEVSGETITTDEYVLLDEQFMLPQLLSDTNPPSLYLKFFITTTLSSGKVITEVDEHWIPLGNYVPAGKPKAWQMNQRFLYEICLKPTARGKNPDTPSDVSILFNPETEDWELVEPVVEIEL